METVKPGPEWKKVYWEVQLVAVKYTKSQQTPMTAVKQLNKIAMLVLRATNVK